MTAYTLFSQSTNWGLISDTTSYTLGMQFSVSQTVSLTGIWFHSATGAGGLPSECAIYDADTATLVSGTDNASPSWSGAAASGWVKCTYDGSVTLSSGVNYVVAVLGTPAANWYSGSNGYWTSGAGGSGLSNGPLSAPNSSSALHGQAVYHAGSTLTFPTSATSGYDFGVDVEVTTISSAVSQPPPPLIPPGYQSPMALTAFMPVPQGGALVSDSDTGTGADTGSVAVAVSDSDTGTGADTGSKVTLKSDADTASGADTGSVAVAVSDSDTASGADTASVSTSQPQPPPPLIPPGFASPMALTAFQPPPPPVTTASDSDTGTGADTGSAAVAVSDSDTASGADTGSVAVAVPDTDTGTGADAGSAAVAVSGGDTASGADTGSVAATAAPVSPPPPAIPPGFLSPMAFTAFRPPPPVSHVAAAPGTVAVSDAPVATVAIINLVNGSVAIGNAS